jgi:aspartyl-tRNA(Asn)/glutamyl-tRNA(Gln) amidotransferase subunit A
VPVVAAPIAREGLPIGIQVIAAPWCEANALRVAIALEQLGVARVSVPAAFA